MNEQTATAAAIEHRSAMQALGLAAQLIENNAQPLRALIEAESRMHSSLMITDPTTYRRAIHDPGLADQVALASAALAFLGTVTTIRDRALERKRPQP